MSQSRVFSGIQPTGDIHLGNYLGAIKQWVKSQGVYENFFCVVNSHAITVPQDPKVLRDKTFDLCAMLIACGIDPSQSTLFIQSQVQEHTSLAWLLNCITPMGDLSRMTQFKDKSQGGKQVLSGLLNYPCLMASDILLYETHLVPVGEDQKQHIELTRNLAIKFNRTFGETFIIPDAMIQKEGARIMGLDDPTKKMSKSHAINKPSHLINLLDEPSVILSKFKKATTDSENKIAFDSKRAGVFNLLNIYQCISGKSKESIEEEFSNKGYGDLKARVAEVVIEELRPIRENYAELTHSKDYLSAILEKGVHKAREVASKTYNKAKENMGLV